MRCDESTWSQGSVPKNTMENANHGLAGSDHRFYQGCNDLLKRKGLSWDLRGALGDRKWTVSRVRGKRGAGNVNLGAGRGEPRKIGRQQAAAVRGGERRKRFQETVHSSDRGMRP